MQSFIGKAKLVHGNKYDYSKVDYVNSTTKVIIICSKHGKFLQMPNNHIQGRGCKKCSVKKIDLLQPFIEKARKVHGTKYDYSNVKYVNSKTKVTIICAIHGEFSQLPTSHVNGNGCRKCSNDAKKIPLQNFIEKAKIIHENKYDYSKVNYVTCDTKVIIICPIHGEFLQSPLTHLQSHGCKKCNHNSNKLTLPNFIEKARLAHGLKYDYSKVDYVNSYTKVNIICPEHGEFLQLPSNHLFGSGCIKCSIIRSKIIRSNNKK